MDFLRRSRQKLARSTVLNVKVGIPPPGGGGAELEAQLLELKGHDPKLAFLKPYHPLHAYYQVT